MTPAEIEDARKQVVIDALSKISVLLMERLDEVGGMNPATFRAIGEIMEGATEELPAGLPKLEVEVVMTMIRKWAAEGG